MGKDECNGSPPLLRAGDKALVQTFTHSEAEKESELHSSTKLPRLLCRTLERFQVCFCFLVSLALQKIPTMTSLGGLCLGFLMLSFAEITILKVLYLHK